MTERPKPTPPTEILANIPKQAVVSTPIEGNHTTGEGELVPLSALFTNRVTIFERKPEFTVDL